MIKLNINIDINEQIYIKDPSNTKLGQKIIGQGLLLINELGIDGFSFGKLAKKIESTESSIYRYFENKHYLFVYLLNWNWEWLRSRIGIELMNIKDPELKLEKLIDILIDSTNPDMSTPFIDEGILHQVVVREGAKAYHHIFVDDDNKHGFFLAYTELTNDISDIILEINPNYAWPKSLASTIIESVNNNIYFAKHLPRLSDMVDASEAMAEDLKQFILSLVATPLKQNNNKPTVSNGIHHH